MLKEAQAELIAKKPKGKGRGRGRGRGRGVPAAEGEEKGPEEEGGDEGGVPSFEEPQEDAVPEPPAPARKPRKRNAAQPSMKAKDSAAFSTRFNLTEPIILVE